MVSATSSSTPIPKLQQLEYNFNSFRSVVDDGKAEDWVYAPSRYDRKGVLEQLLPAGTFSKNDEDGTFRFRFTERQAQHFLHFLVRYDFNGQLTPAACWPPVVDDNIIVDPPVYF